MKILGRSLFGLILLGVFLSGVVFASEDPYSINKTQTSLGESRSLGSLLLSSNRLELKDKIEFIIYNSSVRNFSLKGIANLTWKAQQASNFVDFQFFSTEIFYGKHGEVFPKYTACDLYNFDTIEINKLEQTNLIFLLLPLKQEIETNKLHKYQKRFSVCNNFQNLELFSNKFQKDGVNILNLYKIFRSEKNQFYEFGDTHWNDFGVKTTFVELLSITHQISDINLSKKGKIRENNLVLKRLGLVDQLFYQDSYEINYKADQLKSLLIIHDSFFQEPYVSETFMSQYYNFDLLNWGEIETMSNYEIQNVMKNH